MRGLLLIVLCVCCSRQYAQDFGAIDTDAEGFNQPYLYNFFGAAAGVALPLGSFKSNDFFNLSSGYAMQGFAANLVKFEQRFDQHLGVSLNWNMTMYEYDIASYLKVYNQEYSGIYSFDGKAEQWRFHNVSASLLITAPYKRLTLQGRIGVGIGRLTRPQLTINIYDLATIGMGWIWTQHEVTHHGAVACAGYTFTFHATPKFDLMFTSEYARMRANYEVVEFINLTQTALTNTVTIVESLSLMFGMGLNF
ncbi:MAG: hypothetical protein Kow0075_13750 [Salibacteraceae bacterium]